MRIMGVLHNSSFPNCRQVVWMKPNHSFTDNCQLLQKKAYALETFLRKFHTHASGHFSAKKNIHLYLET